MSPNNRNPRGAVPEPAPPQAEAPALNSTARWVLGVIGALALAIVPGLIAWGVASAQLEDARDDISRLEMKVEKLAETSAAHGPRLSGAERRIIEHEEALKALRSDSARTAEAVAETNGILKVLLRD